MNQVHQPLELTGAREKSSEFLQKIFGIRSPFPNKTRDPCVPRPSRLAAFIRTHYNNVY